MQTCKFIMQIIRSPKYSLENNFNNTTYYHQEIKPIKYDQEFLKLSKKEKSKIIQARGFLGRPVIVPDLNKTFHTEKLSNFWIKKFVTVTHHVISFKVLLGEELQHEIIILLRFLVWRRMKLMFGKQFKTKMARKQIKQINSRKEL